MGTARDLTLALGHLRAAQRLLRGAYALAALVPLGKAIRATERLLTTGRPVQPTLELEAPDGPSL